MSDPDTVERWTGVPRYKVCDSCKSWRREEVEPCHACGSERAELTGLVALDDVSATLERAEARNAEAGWVRLTEEDRAAIRAWERAFPLMAGTFPAGLLRKLSSTEGDDE